MNTQDFDKLFEDTMKNIATASNQRDLTTVKMLTARAAEIETLKASFIEISLKFEKLAAAPNTNQQKQANDHNLRMLDIEVTAGMIRQNLLTLTKHTKSGLVKVGEEFVVRTEPFDDLFKTELLVNGNKFRERSLIAKFYRDTGVKPDDIVELQETEPGKWILRKAPTGKYKTKIQRILDEYA